MRVSKGVDANDLKQGQNSSIDMPATGAIDKNDFYDHFETVESIIPSDQLAAHAFFEEVVEVEITPTDNPRAEQVINLCCNGINQFMIRGVKTPIKRKFLEILARAKTETIATPEFIDGNGDRSTRVVKSQGLRYPFRVLRDDNPNGRAWLENVLIQGA